MENEENAVNYGNFASFASTNNVASNLDLQMKTMNSSQHSVKFDLKIYLSFTLMGADFSY